MLEKPFLVVLNKTDKEGGKEKIASFRHHYPYPLDTLYEISALEEKGLKKLIEGMHEKTAG